MNISYLIPCYNEEKNIEKVYNQIIEANNKSALLDFEIILINDCSTDNTLNILIRLKKNDDRIQILDNNKNLGLGKSIKVGLKKAKKDYIMYLPGDNCHSSSEISKLISIKNNYDIILSYYSNKNERAFFRRMFTAFYTPFLNFIFRKNLPYYNGIAVYKKNIINKINIKTSGFTWQIELLIKTLKNKQIKLALEPTILNERNEGKSKAFRIKNCFIVIYSIINIWLWNIFN